jgi:cell division protein FtsW
LQGDRGIWLSVLLLMIISVLAVYSSTGALAMRYQGGNTEYYLLKHVVMLAMGLGILYVVHRVDYRFFARYSRILLWATIGLLAVTIGQGEEAAINTTNRWLNILGYSFQPSDLAKFSITVYLAGVLTRRQEILRDFRKGFLPIVATVMLVCGLIAPANLSTALLVFGCSILLMYTSGISGRHILGLMLVGLVGMVLLFALASRSATWESRLDDFLCPITSAFTGEQCQIHPQRQQSYIAIASGGLLGNGAGRSAQRNVLPHAYSDFIFAVIIEEYGFVGGFLVLALYLVIFIRTIAIATVSKTFGALLASGLGFLIVAQALVNMGVTVGILPVTGLPLPLLSMGGTSVLFTCLSLGVILSVSREAVGGVRNLAAVKGLARLGGNRHRVQPDTVTAA